MTTSKNIFDYSHVKSVSASILLDENKNIAGKIIANWSDNRNGSVCTAQVILFKEFSNLKPKSKKLQYSEGSIDQILIGKAGGYGYDKLSSAIGQAIRENTTERPKIDFDGVGESAVRDWFKRELNLDLVTVL